MNRRIHPARRALASAFAVIALIAGCASSPRIYSTANPAVDLSDYTTFGFSPTLGTDREAGQRSILSSNLISAARLEMEKLGYRYSDSNPDLEVNFFLNTKEKVQTTSTPSAGMGYGYYGYRSGMYSTWGSYDTTVTQYTEGTLNIDVVDNARNELVWEGVAVGRLRENARDDMQARVNEVMAEIFARHPLAKTS